MDRARRLPSPSHQVKLLERLTASIRAGESRPDRIEIEQELERGLALLMSLEAQISRARHDGTGSGDARGAPLREQEQLALQLRNAASQLRTLSRHDDPPRIGYGFVLPQRSERRHASL